MRDETNESDQIVQKRKISSAEYPTTPDVDGSSGKLVSPPQSEAPRFIPMTNSGSKPPSKRAKVDVVTQLIKVERKA